MRYILDQPAVEMEVPSNDGGTISQDNGNGGKRLADFMQHADAVAAKLEPPHAASLRLYSSSSFRRINDPLRNRASSAAAPHPLAATALFVDKALRKLRVVAEMGHQASTTGNRAAAGGSPVCSGAGCGTFRRPSDPWQRAAPS